MFAVEGVDHFDVDLCAFERRIIDAADVVEEITAEGAVRVDGGALEAEVSVVFGDLLVDRGVVDSDGNGERQGLVHALLQVEEAAVDLVEIGGGDFVVGGGDELDADIGEGERGVAVVGDDDANRDEAVLNVGKAEEAALVRVVAGIDSDGDVLLRMFFEGGVLIRGFDWGRLVACGERGNAENAGGGDDSQSL